MLKRICPECGNKTLEVPIVSSNFICNDCASIFHLSPWVRVLAVVIEIVVFLLLLELCFSLLGSSTISILEFGVLIYLVIPFIGAIIVAFLSRRCGVLVLKGVKGLRRGNS
jgi:hypothetical protein